jgi:hypothetical protein
VSQDTCQVVGPEGHQACPSLIAALEYAQAQAARYRGTDDGVWHITRATTRVARVRRNVDTGKVEVTRHA